MMEYGCKPAVLQYREHKSPSCSLQDSEIPGGGHTRRLRSSELSRKGGGWNASFNLVSTTRGLVAASSDFQGIPCGNPAVMKKRTVAASKW